MSEDSKRKEQERLRKQHQRAKKRAIEEGNYVFTPIEKAKKLLEEMAEPSLEDLFLNEDIASKLTADDRRPLQNFFQYLKQKRKRELEEEKKRLEQEQQISEKGRSFGNQKTYDLQQQLLMPMQEEERARVIKSVIDTNLFLFLEYMEAYQPPFNDFLKIVIGLQGQVDKSSFTELLVRVCTYQKIEDLKVTQDMVLDAIGFLVSKKKDEKAAYGLLRLIYQNSISLSGFPHGSLIKFQADYEQTILRFFKSIPALETQVVESLPATPFCFTTPIIKSLKDGGKVFFTQIPYRFMPFVIQIVCFSFTESTASFENFLTVFRDGMKEHYNILLQNRFTELLQRILDDCIAMNKKCFGSLDSATTILQRAFQLLKQRKFEQFSSSFISSLVDGDDQAMEQIKQMPSIVPQNSQMKISKVYKEIQRLNHAQILDEQVVCKDLNLEGLSNFMASGIQAPLPIQIICYNYCTNLETQPRFIIQLDTGMGKTALCLSVAHYFAQLGRKVAIINYSDELSFRDFKKAETQQSDHGVSIYYKNDILVEASLPKGISFCSFECLKELLTKNADEDFSQVVVIADEVDSIIFSKKFSFQEVQRSLTFSFKMIGFTGSDLQDCHVKAVEKTIGGTLIRMNVNNIYKPPPVSHGVEVIDKIQDFRELIVTSCTQQVPKTPVIIIVDDCQRFLEKKLQKAGIFVEALHNKTIFESNALMMNFNKKNSEKYPIFIINDSQGRGLDFPTSTEVEEQGGVFLIIAKLPAGFLQFKQFLGRTGRMGNKAQYSIILVDKESKNEDGQQYLDKKLTALFNQDLALITQWISSSDCKAQKELIEQAPVNIPAIPEAQQKVELSQINNIREANEDMTAKVDINKVFDEKNQEVQISNPAVLQLQHEEEKKELDGFSNTIRKRESKRIGKKLQKCSAPTLEFEKQKELRDKIYFDNYGKADIHEQMCNDQVRIKHFQDAIAQTCKDKVVIDVGAGTGLLTFYATENGAKVVYSIEQAVIASKIKKEISNRGISDSVKLLNCLAEQAPLDKIAADVIISEWMGYFLLFERMLPSVLDVRDRCLIPGGVMIPCSANILLAAASIPKISGAPIHGAQLGAVSLHPIIHEVQGGQIKSKEEVVLSLDLYSTPRDFNNFSSSFELTINTPSRINALVGWFDVQMTKDMWMSTGPFNPQTHWHQTVLPIMEEIQLEAGSKLRGEIECTPMLSDHRGLRITLDLTTQETVKIGPFEYMIY